jgi:hypothetical protein
MEFTLEWGRPLTLQPATGNAIYSLDLQEIPSSAGVYVFFRRFGDAVEALYVGQSENLKKRIKQDLNSVTLVKGIENAREGTRCVMHAVFRAKQGQRANCLLLIERALIRYYLAQGHELLNIQGKRIPRHSLTSERKDSVVKLMIPPEMSFDA